MRTGLPSSTAIFTLSARAAELNYPASERVLDDPVAARLLQHLGMASAGMGFGLKMLESGGVASFVAARHRLLDDLFLEAHGRGVRQVVNLGCGLDARLLRFADKFKEGLYFEVDHPSTFRLKSSLLKAIGMEAGSETTRRVAVNFERDDLRARLLGAGFDRSQRSFVFWEGVTYYLEKQALHATLGILSALMPSGSELAFDYWNPRFRWSWRLPKIWVQQQMFKGSLAAIGEPLKTPLRRSQLALTLAAHGFEVAEHFTARNMKERYLPPHSRRRIFNQMPVVLARRR